MRTSIYLATFFFTLSYAFVLYINSSFLGRYFSSEGISALYTGSAFLAIALLSYLPHVINRYRRYWVTIVTLGIGISAVFALASTNEPGVIAALFLLVTALQIVLRYLTDVYLEQYSEDANTGRTRGIQLTVMNSAIALSPFIVGKLLANNNFSLIYTTAGALLFPMLWIVVSQFHKIPHQKYDESSLFISLGKISRNPALRLSFAANFILEFFYVWMTIYMPLYLSQVIGFSWPEIGIIFSIMLLPFVFFELPLGKIADTVTGEGWILSVGFFIMSFFTAALAYLSGAHLAAWATLLFMTRVGASAVEIMSESHFFKNVSVHDANLIGVFRDTRPFALILAPLIGNMVLVSYGYTGIWLGLSALLLLGMQYGFRMHSKNAS